MNSFINFLMILLLLFLFLTFLIRTSLFDSFSEFILIFLARYLSKISEID